MKLEQEIDLEAAWHPLPLGYPGTRSRGRDSNLHIYHYRMKLKLILMLYSVPGPGVESGPSLPTVRPYDRRWLSGQHHNGLTPRLVLTAREA